jgi:hypothetical protein
MKLTTSFALAVALAGSRAALGQDVGAPPSANAPAATPSPSPAPAQPGTTFDPQLLRDVPAGHDVWSLFETVDATAVLDRMSTGGLFVGEPGLLGIQGASWTQPTWRLGDADVTDPDRGGVPLLFADPEWLDSIDARTALMPAEAAGPGAAVALVPRRPGASWHGMAGADGIPTSCQSDRQTLAPRIARYDSFASGRFRIDGPLVADRVGLLLAGSILRAKRLERTDEMPLEGREAGGLAHLVWTPRETDEVRFLGAVQGVTRPYAGRARFAGGAAAEDDSTVHAQSTWQRKGAKPWSVTAGFTRARFEPKLDGLAAAATVDRLHDGPVPDLFAGDSTRTRFGIGVSAAPFAAAHHQIRIGASAAWTRSTTRPADTLGFTAETVGGLPARVWDYGWAGPESRRRAFDLGVFAADRLDYGRLSLDAGLRFDLTSASAEGAATGIDWNGLSPRLSARVRLLDGDGLAVRAGYARYRHRLPLALLAFGDPAGPQGDVYRWRDPDGDGVFQPRELRSLVARVGPGGALSEIDPALRTPHTDEIAVGLEARFGTWTARALAIHRREDDLPASVDVGAPAASAYTVRYVEDPGGDILGSEDDQLLPVYDRLPASFGQDHYRLTTPDDGNTTLEGVEIGLDGRIGKRWRLLLGATTVRYTGPNANRGFLPTENDQGLAGERQEEPNALTFSRGRLFFDRAYTIKLATLFRGPWDLRAAAVARYQDGQPFARVVVPSDLAQGPEPIQAIPNGRARFTYTLSVDARVEKGVSLGRARLAAVFEAFNLLDNAHEVEEDVVTGPAYRTITAVQPPRALRLGVRVDF